MRLLDIHVKMSKFSRWLSIRENSFGVGSVCDEIISAYAQPSHAVTFVNGILNNCQGTHLK
jgi:hypothetical protein